MKFPNQVLPPVLARDVPNLDPFLEVSRTGPNVPHGMCSPE